MNMKQRSDSALAKLSTEEQDTLYEWLHGESYVEVKKRVAKPKPEGFEIEVQLTSLRRFWRKRYREEQREAIEEAKENPPVVVDVNLAPAADQSIDYMAYDMASSGRLEAFNSLSRWQTRRKALELKEGFLAVAKEQLALEREKFEFDASRAALEHANALQAIAVDRRLDDSAKIQKAREQMFGPNLPK